MACVRDVRGGYDCDHPGMRGLKACMICREALVPRPSPEARWLELYSSPASVVFNRTPEDWDVLRRLVDEGRIVPTGRVDAGGHALYVARQDERKAPPCPT